MRFFFVLAVVLSLGAQPALAQEPAGPDAAIAQLQSMMFDARFDDALVAARALLARTDLNAAQRNATLESLAIAQLAARDRRGATETLALLYSRDPDHRMLDRDASPAVVAAFDRAREAHPAPATVTIESAVPLELPERAVPVLQVRLTAGADIVNELRLSYRQGESRDFQRVVMEHAADLSTAQARVPVLEGDEAYSLEWFVEALAPSQTIVGRLGDAAGPLSLAIPHAAPRAALTPTGGDVVGGAGRGGERDEGGSVLGEWWFWTVVGVVIAGGAVATYFLTLPADQTPCGTLGCGSL